LEKRSFIFDHDVGENSHQKHTFINVMVIRGN